MIIQSSNVQLGQVNRFDSHFSDRQSMRLGMEIQAREQESSARGMISRLAFQSEERFDYSHRSHSAYLSESSIKGVNGEESQFQREKMSSEVVQLSLVGTEATVAAMRAFPANEKSSIEVTGKLEFEFHRQVQVETASHTSMSASGKVTLQDGREIDFSLFTAHGASTRVSAESRASLSLSMMQDPLVINFGADKVQLSDQYIEFDLTGDGDKENIAKLGAGSGYLMLDLDGDGKVTDGTELFGTESGNGFVDLAKYDSDGNGWIDEADPIFKELKLWAGGENKEQLVSLAERGVGAIYLGQVEQAEDVRSEQGELLAHVKAAGIVLMESGEVKTAQAIDLAERAEEKTEAAHSIGNVEEIEALVSSRNEASAALSLVNLERLQLDASAMRTNMALPINWSNETTLESEELPEWSLEKMFQEMHDAIQKTIERRKAMMEKLDDMSSRVRQSLSIIV